MKFQSFLNFTKKIIEIIKMFLTFLIFYLFSSSFFFSDFTFYKEALCFIIFILSLCSNTLTLESIFEYIRQKNIYICTVILNFHPRMKCLHVFFDFFHPCLFDRDEFIPGRNFISAKTCKQEETFQHK